MAKTSKKVSASATLHGREYTFNHDSRLVKIAAVFPEGANLRVFDAGCGDARLSQGLVKQGHRVTGLDSHTAALRKAKQRGLKTLRGDVEGRWPVPASSQDVVLLLDVLEHTVDHEFVLKEAHRVLTKQGSLIVAYPNHFDLRGRVAMLRGQGIVHWDQRKNEPAAWTYGHLRFLRWRELALLLQASDFTVEVVQFNFMGGGLLPRRLLPARVRRGLLGRWPELLSGKFIVRARPSNAPVKTSPHRILLDRTPLGL